MQYMHRHGVFRLSERQVLLLSLQDFRFIQIDALRMAASNK